MWSVRAASRLHLGLLCLPRPDADEARARRFGGVGLMIDSPGLVVRADPAEAWSADGPLGARALAFAHQLERTLRHDHPSLPLPPRRLVIGHAPRAHVGLGSGTQLALAVARVLTSSWGRLDPAADLARLVGRGQRSALGVHGFSRGGFLVEAGKLPGQPLSPLVARLEIPDAWRVVVLVPPGAAELSPFAGLHGAAEQSAFAGLVEPPGWSESLCRLVLLGILPALVEADLAAFGEAVFEFNARVGALFAPLQGGTYSSPAVADAVAELRRLGVAGVGQSSWGPAVFAFVADDDQARRLAARVRAWPGLGEETVWVAAGWNHGARLLMAGAGPDS